MKKKLITINEFKIIEFSLTFIKVIKQKNR